MSEPALSYEGTTTEVHAVPQKTSTDQEIENRIRAYLREYQAERQIDQVEFARRLGVTQGAVSRVLAGGRGIGLGLALKISKLLCVPMPRLLEEDPPEAYWAAGTYPRSRDGRGPSRPATKG